VGEDLLGDEETELDADADEPDALVARLGAGHHVVVPGQLAALHAGAVG